MKELRVILYSKESDKDNKLVEEWKLAPNK